MVIGKQIEKTLLIRIKHELSSFNNTIEMKLLCFFFKFNKFKLQKADLHL